MNTVVRTILSSYLSDGKIPAVNELDFKGNPLATGKDPVFVTFYKGGKVIASSGRIHSTKNSTALELIENSLLCLKDPRISEAMKSIEDLGNISIRVDILVNGGRKILSDIEKLDMNKEGLIFLSQGRNKASVILPNMTNVIEKSTDLLSIAKKKAEVEEDINPNEYVLYALTTQTFSDF